MRSAKIECESNSTIGLIIIYKIDNDPKFIEAVSQAILKFPDNEPFNRVQYIRENYNTRFAILHLLDEVQKKCRISENEMERKLAYTFAGFADAINQLPENSYVDYI